MMKIETFARIGAGALVAICVTAAGVHAADEISASHLKAARAAMTAIKITDPFDNILPTIAQQLKGTMIQGSPNYEPLINATVDEEALKLAARRSDLEKEAAAIYAKAFTEEELNQIAAFYNTPAGQKLLKDGPLVIRELSKAGDIWASGISRDMTKAAGDALEKKIGEMVEKQKKEQPQQ
jgi:hypothetical protein